MGELIQIEKHKIEDAEEQEYRVVEINLTNADKGKAAALRCQTCAAGGESSRGNCKGDCKTIGEVSQWSI